MHRSQATFTYFNKSHRMLQRSSLGARASLVPDLNTVEPVKCFLELIRTKTSQFVIPYQGTLQRGFADFPLHLIVMVVRYENEFQGNKQQVTAMVRRIVPMPIAQVQYVLWMEKPKYTTAPHLSGQGVYYWDG
jgi:hypothetical protein